MGFIRQAVLASALRRGFGSTVPVRSVVCSLVVMLALALGAVAVLAPLATAASSAGQHPQGSERPSTLTDGTWPGTQGPRAASQYTGYPYRNAPECTAGTYRCVADQWLFFQGQCTSWVAYRLNKLNGIAFTNSYGGAGNWGDATKWGSHAGTLGVDVNGTPAVGAVAWYSWGHVAYVEKVNSLTSVDISEMNYDNANGLRVRTITTASAWPSGFIHIKDLKVSDRPHNETFVQVTGQGQVSPVADEAGLLVSPATALAPSQPDPGLSAQQIDRPPHPGGHRPPVASGPVTTYDLRYERAPYGGPFTAWVTPAPWQGLPTTGVGVGLSPGYDYCFQARVHNTVGPWSPPRACPRLAG